MRRRSAPVMGLLLLAVTASACADQPDTSVDPAPSTSSTATVTDEVSATPTAVESSTPAYASDGHVQGIDFVLPPGHGWTIAERATEVDDFTASLDGSFATSITVARLAPGTTIESWLERQRQLYDDEGYEVPEDWYQDVDVAGADAAVQLSWASGSGDGAITTRLLAIGNVVVSVESYQYIEDLELLESQEVDAFFASIRVDRDAFEQAAS